MENCQTHLQTHQGGEYDSPTVTDPFQMTTNFVSKMKSHHACSDAIFVVTMYGLCTDPNQEFLLDALPDDQATVIFSNDRPLIFVIASTKFTFPLF